MMASFSATWLSVNAGSAQVAPHEHHRRARRGGQQDQAGDVGVELRRRQLAGEQVADEDPAQQRHRKGLYRPVDEQRDADALPLPAHIAQRAEVDLQQHRDDHQPDQHGDRQVHLRQLHAAQRREAARQQVSQQGAGDDAQQNP
jgi:hypothetical protein